MQTALAPEPEAIRLRCCTRKQDEQVNSSACFGTTGMVNSSPDRSAPGKSTLSPASPSSRSTSGDCASVRAVVSASSDSVSASSSVLRRGAS